MKAAKNYSDRLFFLIKKEQINESVHGIEPGTPAGADRIWREYP